MTTVQFVGGGFVHTSIGELSPLREFGVVASTIGDNGVPYRETPNGFPLTTVEFSHLAFQPIAEGVLGHLSPVPGQEQRSVTGHPSFLVLAT